MITTHLISKQIQDRGDPLKQHLSFSRCDCLSKKRRVQKKMTLLHIGTMH
jgi:hypothetical protein